MGLDRWPVATKTHRRALILAALLSTFAGVALVIDQPKGTFLEWLAVPFLVGGAALFAWAVWPHGVATGEATPSLAGKLLRWLTWQGRLVPFFPAIGAGIFALDIAYNVVIASRLTFGTEDIITILSAAAMIGYPFIPSRLARERDFVLVFFLTLLSILVVPLLAARALYHDFERSVDIYSWVALAPEAGALLSLVGVANAVHAVAGSTAPGLTFTPKHIGVPVTVVITTACSGIYSFGIFASAFVAFVLTEYERPSPRIWALLGLGFVASYFANVLRMVVIVLVGYYTDVPGTDLQNMLIAHSYGGWIIFLGWLSLFWSLVLKFMPMTEPAPASPSGHSREAICCICDTALTPAIPAGRCECGAYHHQACAAAEGACRACGRVMPAKLATAR